jgi:hypothetical protein
MSAEAGYPKMVNAVADTVAVSPTCSESASGDRTTVSGTVVTGITVLSGAHEASTINNAAAMPAPAHVNLVVLRWLPSGIM